ncbi:MAG: hypothetical protein EBV06_01965 [Planctomycetia bacterium]|nr:hypothetical protein [Planctomycetia bacterium]
MLSLTWRLAAGCVLMTVVLAQAQNEPRPAAVVNGVPINVAEVDAQLKQDGLDIPQSDVQRRLRRMEALGMLIDKMLLRQFLDKKVGSVAPEEINKKLSDFESSLLRQERKMSLAEYCQDTNQTLEQLKEGLCDHIRWNAFINPHLSDAYLEQYYKENQDYFDKVTVRASHIVLRVTPGMSQTDKERLRSTLTEIRAKLISEPSADFAELAKKHSNGPHASRGGDVGYFPRKWAMDEAFARNAFSLPVGAISEIVETPYGLHLIKVTDRRPGESADFARIKETVRTFCSEEIRHNIISEQRRETNSAITIDLP